MIGEKERREQLGSYIKNTRNFLSKFSIAEHITPTDSLSFRSDEEGERKCQMPGTQCASGLFCP